MDAVVPPLALLAKFAKDPSPALVREFEGATSAAKVNALIMLDSLLRAGTGTLRTAITAFGVTRDDVLFFARQEASREHPAVMVLLMELLCDEPAAKRVCRRPRLELEVHQRVCIYDAKGELADFGRVTAVEGSRVTVRLYLFDQVVGDPILYVVEDGDPLGETCVFAADDDDRLVHEGRTLRAWTDRTQF
jgi:hypothetical protein